MKQVSIIVTDETARRLNELLDHGITPSSTAFNLALFSRPVKGERWIRIGDVNGGVTDSWARLPALLRCGTRR